MLFRSEAIGIAGLGEKRLGSFDVLSEFRQRKMLGLHGADMIVVGNSPAFREHEVLDRGIVDGLHDRLAHADIVERLLINLHAAAERLRGLHGLDLRAFERTCQFQLIHGQFVDHVDAAGGDRRGLVVLIVIVELDLIEIDVAAPIFQVLAVGGLGYALQYAALADLQFRQRIGAGSDRVVRERRLEGGMRDEGRILGAVFRDPKTGKLVLSEPAAKLAE